MTPITEPWMEARRLRKVQEIKRGRIFCPLPKSYNHYNDSNNSEPRIRSREPPDSRGNKDRAHFLHTTEELKKMAIIIIATHNLLAAIS